MRMALSAAAALALAAGPALAQELPAPIAPATQGKAQCYEPDTAAKTCRSIAKYQRDPAGEILNPSLVLISDMPLIVFASTTKVTVRGGQVCGVVQVSDIRDGEFLVDGMAPTAQQAADLRHNLAVAEADILGKEICTSFTPDGAGFLARATVGGAPQPEPQHVIWISDDDGYTLGP